MMEEKMKKPHHFNRAGQSSRYSLVSLVGLIFFLFLASACNSEPGDSSTPSGRWIGTWTTAQQLVEPRNMPPEPGLTNNTLRQIVHVSIGGDSLRVRFSNEFSTRPVTIKTAHIAVSAGGGAIVPETDQVLTFNGEKEVTMEPGTAVRSDPFGFALEPLGNVAITIYFSDTSPDVTGHPGSRTTSYLLAGNAVSDVEFTGASQTDHWYVIDAIDVVSEESPGAVAVLGNSITDGRGSGTNKQNRWPDELARRLQKNPETRQVAVLNQGIGGNCVLRDCLGPAAVSRFERDVLNAIGVRWLIVLEGINDIGQTRNAEAAAQVADNLIAAYQKMIERAHSAGIRVYGGTLMPVGGSFYDAPFREKARNRVNKWIRNSGQFDAVIDFDEALRDPDNPRQLLPAADTGDHLHPNETGHQLMAETVDLRLFE